MLVDEAKDMINNAINAIMEKGGAMHFENGSVCPKCGGAANLSVSIAHTEGKTFCSPQQVCYSCPHEGN